MSGTEVHRDRTNVTLVEILWSWETQLLMVVATYYHYYQAIDAENDALKECACAEQVRSAGTLEIMISVWYAFQVGVSLAVGVGYLSKRALRQKVITLLLALAAYLEEPLEEEPWQVVREVDTERSLHSSRRGRDVETQSQVTYRRDLSQPRFQPLSESMQGAWIQPKYMH